MRKLEKQWKGQVNLEIRGPEPERLLNLAAAGGLTLERPEAVDRCTLRLNVPEGELAALKRVAEGCGCELTVLSLAGGSGLRRMLRRRLVLLLMIGFLTAALLFSSLFIWEIRIVGEAPDRGRLLRILEDCGVTEGCFWPDLDVDAIRDRVLLQMPELAWMTVNVRGSVAQVLVERRQMKPEIWREAEAADLVASHAGIVRQMSVLSGQGAVQPGRAVTPGETLIAGRGTALNGDAVPLRARGRVWADTWYELTAVCPPAQRKQTQSGGRKGRLALVVGEKRINFYHNSGKAIDGCDKIVHEYTLGIKGLFRLPVRLVWEELRPYRSSGETLLRSEETQQRLLAQLEERIEGEILSSRVLVSSADGLQLVTLYASCREDIARTTGPGPG